MPRLMSVWLLAVPLSATGPHALPVQEPVELPLDLLVDARALCWDSGSGEVRVETAAGDVVAFDVFLRPLEAPSGPLTSDAVPVEGGQAEAPGWSGRMLQLDAEMGQLRVGAAVWEVPPRLRWGPGWVCVEFRGAQAGGTLEWSTAGRSGSTRFRCDRSDGLWQRAWVEGLEPGETLGLRWLPPRREWPRDPIRAGWSQRVVPEVDPAGERPTEAWR